MEIKLLGKLTPLCFLPSNKLVCYKNGNIHVYENGVCIDKFRIICSFNELILSRIKLLNRLFRLGIRSAISLSENIIITSIGNNIREIDIKSRRISFGFKLSNGIRPLIFTEVKDIFGFDDGFYFGAYLSNPNKNPVSIYKRITKDFWQPVYTFDKGAINHIHNLIPDKFRNCVWIFTGDFAESAAIWKATNNFKTVTKIFSNHQKYRGCVGFPIKEGLLYATDSPFEQNKIYLLDNTYTLKNICEINGSCIYGCQVEEDFIFSTTVEPDGRNINLWNFMFSTKRGIGIKDDNVYLYKGNLKDNFSIIYKEKKDFLPYCSFQFGVFKFPYGVNNTDKLYVHPIATENDSKLILIQLE